MGANTMNGSPTEASTARGGDVLAALPQHLVQQKVAEALAEDLGLAGDLTSQAIFSTTDQMKAEIVARAPCVVAGLALASAAFRQYDSSVETVQHVEDGARVPAGTVLMTLQGKARSLLGAERVALNFLGQLSGVATLTARFVDAVAGLPAQICCTRKTVPGLRALQKYAVRAGGGVNHRFGLFDAVLIKDNHIAAVGNLTRAIAQAKAQAGHLVKIEVEVDRLDQLSVALESGIDAVLLDNMDIKTLRQAVAMVRAAAAPIICEASGGITLDNVKAVAQTGVDLISVGALTHSAPCVDLGLDCVIDHR